ncbi:MAG: cytidylate kinase-like family protein [Lachnospiraceae bacterium]|nr:cytidylate kinase-like family protein [Lachnospiraceae bacterium]
MGEKQEKSHYVVTINRQFGSMGRPIAKKLAERLGIAYYDRDIVDETAKSMNLPQSTIGELEESVKDRFFNMKYPLGMGTTDIQDQIFDEQVKIIKKLAYKDSCIVVGRCADYILREFPNSIHIYIYASAQKRLQVCIEEFNMQADEAKRMMLEVDKARERYHKQYAGYLPGDVRYKNLMIDSGVLGVDKTVDVLEAYVRKYFEK